MSDKSTKLIDDPELTVRRDLNHLRLLVVDGPDAGRICNLESDTIIVGSDPSADLILIDSTVSRRHLKARQEADGVWIQDSGSTNGTFFEGSRVKEMVLELGSVFRVGKTMLRVVPLEENLRPSPAADAHFEGVIGQCRRMREIFTTMGEIAETDLTVLIEGETGTGKEALAEAVHSRSARNAGPMIVVDCTTIPHHLAESELFGHKKGAFTGAVANRQGCFEQANGGTIFIDEIGDLPAELQPKLLRVLERRELRSVGSAETKKIDVRVIAATHKSLREEMTEGRFREDLYYRLAVIAVRLPPLRDREADLSLLINHFAARAAEAKGLEVHVPQEALSRFLEYPWPGNVRELRNVVERAIALHKSSVFDPTAFLQELARGLGESTAKGSPHRPFKEAKSQIVGEFERAYLSDLIERCKGNISKAAREADLDRHHLKDLLKKHAIPIKGK